jgi:NAD(P)-dependent dehydrogenase (short-subunit alcohol dehydrogenase family)
MTVNTYQGQIVWLVGASSGIGAALAKVLSQRGARLALSGRRVEALQDLCASLGPDRHRVFPLDISDPAATQTVAHSIKTTMGSMDRVIFMAAGYDPMRLSALDIPLTHQIVTTNLMGAFHLIQAVLPFLRESLHAEEGHHCDVKLISPGFVRTPLTDKNDFSMPMIIEPDQAALAIADGLLSKRFEIHFPKRFTFFLKFLRALPYGLSLKITSRMKG